MEIYLFMSDLIPFVHVLSCSLCWICFVLFASCLLHSVSHPSLVLSGFICAMSTILFSFGFICCSGCCGLIAECWHGDVLSYFADIIMSWLLLLLFIGRCVVLYFTEQSGCAVWTSLHWFRGRPSCLYKYWTHPHSEHVVIELTSLLKLINQPMFSALIK